jgi:hypothetical protein
MTQLKIINGKTISYLEDRANTFLKENPDITIVSTQYKIYGSGGDQCREILVFYDNYLKNVKG